MKIKAISHIATLAITIATLGSCSNIDSDDRLIYVKPAPVKRTVLIEDFTRQKCINCPYAANETEKIITEYGQENIIVVSIHCGLGMNYNPTARYQGLMTTTGNQYYKAWGSPAQPSGLVNRTTAEATTYTTWGSLVRNEIQQTAPIAICLATQYTPDERHLDIDVKVSGTDGNTDGYLQVWLTEDNIISLQDTPQGRDYQYNPPPRIPRQRHARPLGRCRQHHRRPKLTEKLQLHTSHTLEPTEHICSSLRYRHPKPEYKAGNRPTDNRKNNTYRIR